MKLLILTTFDIENKKIELKNCKCQYHIYLFFIYKYLIKYDYEITIKNIPIMGSSNRIQLLYKDFSLNEIYDHCLVIENRGIQRRPDKFFNILREKVKYCISTISANSKHKGKEDVLFYSLPSGKRKRKGSRYIGWACDSEMLYSKQKKNNINILIDHPYYGSGQNMIKQDLTLKISKLVMDWYLKNKNSKNITIKRFCKGGIENVTLNNYNKIDKYIQNEGLNYYDACEIYNTTDIFIVTHPEAMGLVALECAMAGALIVSPEGYIKKDLLQFIHSVSLENNFNHINMDNIVSNIDHKLSRKNALKFNWKNAVGVIHNTFANWNVYKEKDLWFRRPSNAHIRKS